MSSTRDKYVPGKKLVFLDFDGTLADWGEVPPGHVRALQELQERGHLVFLCTGRPLSGVSDDVRAMGFDGLVCAAGGYVLIDDQVLADTRFAEDVANRAVELLDGYDGTYILESPNHVYVRTAAESRLRELFRSHSDMLDRLRVRDDLHGVSFSKITVIQSNTRIIDLAREIGDAVQALPSSIEDRESHRVRFSRATSIKPWESTSSLNISMPTWRIPSPAEMDLTTWRCLLTRVSGLPLVQISECLTLRICQFLGRSRRDSGSPSPSWA